VGGGAAFEPADRQIEQLRLDGIPILVLPKYPENFVKRLSGKDYFHRRGP
jgi:hypothetical protein